jgi:hypothetical protein
MSGKMRYHREELYQTIQTTGNTKMSQKTNNSRRKLLKTVTAGSGAVVAGKLLPESWSKPIVDSVLLPTHAQTTDGTGSAGDGSGVHPGCMAEAIYCDGIVGLDRSVTVDNARSVIVNLTAWEVPFHETTVDASGFFTAAGDDAIGDGISTVTGTIGCGELLSINVLVNGEAETWALCVL